MDNKQQLIDAQNLKKYPEFYALKQIMETFCEEMESIKDLKLDEVSRVTLGEEIAGRVYAATKVRDLLSSLGLVDKSKPRIIDRTGE